MPIIIKQKETGKVLFRTKKQRIETYDFVGKDMRGAIFDNLFLQYVELPRLEHTSCVSTMFQYCSYGYDSINNTNLTDTKFYNCSLQATTFKDNIYNNTIFSQSNLNSCAFIDANLLTTRFPFSSLQEATFDRDTIISKNLEASLTILPAFGTSFVGWKLCKHDKIVKLLIPADARRSNSTSRKCRAEKVVVLEIQDKEGNVKPNGAEAYSMYYPFFAYKQGEVVTSYFWGDHRWTTCAPGIHFFLTREEVVAYEYL